MRAVQFVHEKLANRLRNFSEDAHGPQRQEMRAIEKEPFYGLSLKPLFLLYERIVNSTAALAWARANLLGVFKKPA